MFQPNARVTSIHLLNKIMDNKISNLLSSAERQLMDNPSTAQQKAETPLTHKPIKPSALRNTLFLNSNKFKECANLINGTKAINNSSALNVEKLLLINTKKITAKEPGSPVQSRPPNLKYSLDQY